MRRASPVIGLGLLLLAASTASAAEVAPGVTYTEYWVPVSSGSTKVYVVAADRFRSEYMLEVGYAQKKRNYTGREATSTIAARYDTGASHDVLAAVNGSYFDGATLPRMIGIGQSAGEMLDVPSFGSTYQYQTFMLGATRLPVIRNNFGGASGTVTFADGFTLPIGQYNFFSGGPLVPVNALTVFTPQFDSVTPTFNAVMPSLNVEVVLSNVSYPMRSEKEISGTVTAIKAPTTGGTAIPAGGLVLCTYGSTKNQVVAHTKVGDKMKVRVATDSPEYNTSDMAITGIGWIIHNGSLYTANWSTLDSGAAYASRNPRTVLAWNNTHWFMVVCDGRGAGGSAGFTFTEMGDFLIGTLGALEAVNMDGGGSSTMVLDGTVKNVPSDGGQRLVADAVLLVKRKKTASFPFSDAFAATGRAAGWDDKFYYCDVAPFEPASPGGDGTVLKIATPAAGVNTVRRGDFSDSNYSVQADVYCEYRVPVAADGFERYGIFCRDSGSAAFTLSTYGGGNCYAMTYDTDTGRIRGGKYVNGAFTDFLDATAPTITTSGWHRFRIDASGSSIQYVLDDVPLAVVSDGSFDRGYYGIAYRATFATASYIHGARVDNFIASAGPRPQPGDFDLDGDVDQEDFGRFQACYSGFDPAAPGCEAARMDPDLDVDAEDFTLFFGCMTPPGGDASVTCAD